MSTKASIAHGENFHLYHECFDTDNVYLEVEGTQFEAGCNRVMVPIPVHIWEVIRRYAAADLSLVDKTDEQLRQTVEKDVTERVEDHKKNPKGLATLFGALTYGDVNDPWEQQVERGLAALTAQRNHQREIQAAIKELEKTNKPSS